VVRDGDVEVRAAAPAPRDGWMLGYAEGQVALRLLSDAPAGGAQLVLMDLDDERQRPLPRGADSVAVDPAGTLWVGPGLHEVPVAEVAADRAGELEAWPEVAAPEEVDFLVPGPGRYGRSWDSEVVVALGDDGQADPMLGQVPDPGCGLSRRAASSYTGPTDPAGPAEVGYQGRDAASDRHGALWLALAAPPPAPPGSQVLGRATPDGRLAVVDHPLPGIEAVVPAPDTDGVLVADRTGRVLLLSGPDALADPGTAPDDCYEEEPRVAEPGRFTALPSLPPDAIPLDIAGTALALGGGDPGEEPAPVRRIAPDGTSTELATPGLAEGRRPRAELIRADGAGGAWWVEGALDPSADATAATQLIAVHLTPDGDIERSAPIADVFGAPQDADPDGFYAVRPDDGKLLRVTTDGAEAVGRRELLGRLLAGADLVRTGDGRVALACMDGAPAVHVLERDSFEVLAGQADDVGGADCDRTRRPLAVQLDLDTAPDQLHLTGTVLTDPHGDGVLMLQDGLLVRIAADGTVTPLVQDDRLVDARSPEVLDGHLVFSAPVPPTPADERAGIADAAARETLVLPIPR
jgi:hypothetical protein